MKTGIPMNGSMVKNHISLRTGFELFAIPRTLFPSWSQACPVLPLDHHQPSRTPLKQESHSSSSSSSSPSSPTVGELSVREREDVTNSDISPVPVSKSVDDSSGRPDADQANKTPKTNKKETTIARRNPLCSDSSEIPEWLQEFRENLGG